jgi:hypothetical protein
MVKKILGYIALSLATTIALWAQPGADGLAFLKNGVGGRALAMGEAYGAIASDPSAMYYNPAALAITPSSEILLMHEEWIENTQTEYLAAKSEIGDFSFGAAVNSTSINNIEIRDVPGPAIGTFDSHDASVGLSGAYAFDSTFAIGVTANYLYEKIYYAEATGGGFSFGAIYQSPWNIRFGASVSNLGSMGVLDSLSSTLPTSIRVGAGDVFKLDDHNSTLTVAADLLSYTVEDRSHLLTGVEYNYQNTVAFRVGYQTGYDSKSFSAGFGVKYQFLHFDYAFVPFQNDLGDTNILSLSFEL